MFSFFLAGTVLISHAQSLFPASDPLISKLQTAFNKKQSEDAYNLLTNNYRQNTSADKLLAFMENLNSSLGTWQQTTPLGQLGNTLYYVATFEKGRLQVTLFTDNGLIAGMLFEPITPQNDPLTKKVLTSNTLESVQDKKVDSIIRPYIKLPGSVGLCVAIIDKDKTYMYSYGETRKGSNQLPDPGKTLFEIGSVTKTFTGALFASAILQQQVSADDDIERYLPDSISDLAFGGSPVTLGQLANHTSGLPRLPGNLELPGKTPEDPYRNYDDSMLLSFLRQYKATVKPGTTYNYSNLGAGLLGEILIWQQHTTYEELVTKQILSPLHMQHTRIALSPADSAWLAQGYNSDNRPAAPWNMNALTAAGGVRSTLQDMTRYLQAQLGNAPATLLPALQLSQQITFDDGKNKVALGWHQAQGPKGTILFHSGQTGGYYSTVMFNKEQQTGVIILANKTDVMDALALHLLP